jgi:hypothetical protein
MADDLKDAQDLIREGRIDDAIAKCTAALAVLPPAEHRRVHTTLGLACWYGQRWPEALDWFRRAADGSEVPEDWFNVAMVQVKAGDVEGAHASWQRTFDLSYAHQDAPETSTFFDKKLLFARTLRDAGACDARGLDLLERQLLPFFTNYHVTDPTFWGMRGVPSLEDVLDTIRDYYRAMGRPQADWEALLARIAPDLDDEGKATCDEMRATWT